VEFLIIGAGVSGLTAGSILSEEFTTIIAEREPVRNPKEDLWVVLATPMLGSLRNIGVDENALDPIFLDNIQVHNSDGKVIFEYSYPITITKLSKIRNAFLKNFQLDIMDKTFVSDDFIEEKGIIKKVRIENKRSEVLRPEFIVDASGSSLLVSKRGLISQFHKLYRHNIFRYFQTVFTDINRSVIERETLHVIISDIFTPGGMSSLFIDGDKAHIMGFYNDFLSSVTPLQRGRFIRNSLGVGGKFKVMRDWKIPLSHPIINPTYANTFFVGMANLSIYPFFMSGINHNAAQTSRLMKRLLDITSSGHDIETIRLEYAMEFIYKHLFRGFLNDTMRVLLLGSRAYQLEEMIATFFEILRIIPKVSGTLSELLVIARLVMDTLEKLGLTKKIEKMTSIMVELHRIYEKKPDNINEVQEKAMKFNSFYNKKIEEILPEELKQKISFKELRM